MFNQSTTVAPVVSLKRPTSIQFFWSSPGWRGLILLFLGWLSGLLGHAVVASVELPTYELIREGHDEGSVVSLWPMSQLSIALVPRENTTLLPHLCSFTSDGTSLHRWPLAHRLAYGGTLFVQGEVRDIFSLSSAEYDSTKELVFVISGTLLLCRPMVFAVLTTLDRLGQSGLSGRISSLLGLQTLRLPVTLRATRN